MSHREEHGMNQAGTTLTVNGGECVYKCKNTETYTAYTIVHGLTLNNDNGSYYDFMMMTMK